MSRRHKEVSQALNRWAKEGCDLLGGGADSHALQSFVGDFFTGDHRQEANSMSWTHLLFNIHDIAFYLASDDEGFGGHFDSNTESDGIT